MLIIITIVGYLMRILGYQTKKDHKIQHTIVFHWIFFGNSGNQNQIFVRTSIKSVVDANKRWNLKTRLAQRSANTCCYRHMQVYRLRTSSPVDTLLSGLYSFVDFNKHHIFAYIVYYFNLHR